jgi:transposase InsO family protein
MSKRFVYLVAVMDWFSRRVLAWRVSITMETDFCVEALREAMDRYGHPEIFNTDQGAQFTYCLDWFEPGSWAWATREREERIPVTPAMPTRHARCGRRSSTASRYLNGR